jgi:hypothetical protein
LITFAVQLHDLGTARNTHCICNDMSVMHTPATIGTTSAGSSGGCGSVIMNGEAGGEYPKAGADSAGNIAEVVATIILGLTDAAGSGNGGPGTTGNVCLGLGGTFKRN